MKFSPFPVLFACAALALTATPAVAAPPFDTVTGAGTFTNNNGTMHITVTARGQDIGQASAPGTGNVTIELSGQPALHGTVDCMFMFNSPPSRANVSGQLSDGEFFRIAVTDNGNNGDDAADLRITAEPIGCGGKSPTTTLTDGNFRIVNN
jgi:hypothetical protein